MKHPEGFWTHRTRSLIRRGAVALSLAVGVSLAAAPAANAWTIGGGDNSAYNFASDATGVELLSADELPRAYDLRDAGVVTPVKNQGVWGTCWGFAASAVAETSLLSELQTTYEQTQLDLSELHLAYFAATALPEGDEADARYNNQGGEGYHNALAENEALPDDDAIADILGYEVESAGLNNGGFNAFATSLFSSGIGPIPESMAPYQNAEGIVHSSGAVYDRTGTWALDEDLRLTTAAALEESYVLPGTAIFDEDGTYTYDERATVAIKQQLMEGRAVSVAFYADQSFNGDPLITDGYMNVEHWAHYTYQPEGANHAVTIVGWDDDFSKENFGIADPATGEIDPASQPPADGAWIVKNSWGAQSSEFPNKDDWGDDGYFYMSYYDQSVGMFEAFDFDTEHLGGAGLEEFYTNQYDYLPSGTTYTAEDAAETSAASIFTAEGPQVIDRLSCETSYPNSTVTYKLYRLDDGASDPTDGELLVTLTDTYEYGGYHCIDIPEADQTKTRMASGERVSVVVTIYCNDSGLYYAPVDTAYSEKQRDEWIAELYAEENETHERSEEALEDIIDEYRDEHEGVTDEEVAAWLTENVEAIREQIKTEVTVEIEASVPIYAVAVVNPGESFLISHEGIDDWTEVAASLAAASDDMIVCDNPSIKAYGTVVEPPFPDIPEDAWYFEAVDYAKAHGIMNGYDDTGLFEPETTLTREQAACVMYNWLGDGAKVEATDLADVEQDEYYTDAVNWAVKNKIINGYGDGTFGVGDPLTREQFCCIMANAMATDPGDISAIEGMLGADQVSDWAESGVAWAVANGIMNGVETEDGQRDLQPLTPVSRAEIAAFIMNFLEGGAA